VRYITVDKPLLRLGMTLGEGRLCVCRRSVGADSQAVFGWVGPRVWSLRQDVRQQRLYFVDIDQCKVYTYEPSTETIGYQTFARKVTSIALIAKGDGVSINAPQSRPISHLNSSWAHPTTPSYTFQHPRCHSLQHHLSGHSRS